MSNAIKYILSIGFLKSNAKYEINVNF